MFALLVGVLTRILVLLDCWITHRSRHEAFLDVVDNSDEKFLFRVTRTDAFVQNSKCRIAADGRTKLCAFHTWLTINQFSAM